MSSSKGFQTSLKVSRNKPRESGAAKGESNLKLLQKLEENIGAYSKVLTKPNTKKVKKTRKRVANMPRIDPAAINALAKEIAAKLKKENKERQIEDILKLQEELEIASSPISELSDVENTAASPVSNISSVSSLSNNSIYNNNGSVFEYVPSPNINVNVNKNKDLNRILYPYTTNKINKTPHTITSFNKNKLKELRNRLKIPMKNGGLKFERTRKVNSK